MALRCEKVYLRAERDALASAFDREPFEFEHDLAPVDLFRFSALQHLASLYCSRDYRVASGSADADADRHGMRGGDCNAVEAIERLGSGNARVLLERPERYDGRYRGLLSEVFADVMRQRGGLDGKIVRLESAIHISSARTTTPFHFDPQFSFSFQINGERLYHIYPPATISERELERFSVKSISDVGYLRLTDYDRARERVLRLTAGNGMHQPRNAPHWAQTGDRISVSYVVAFETDISRALGRARAFNFYARAAGLTPARIGSRPSVDRIKARTMQVAIPARESFAAVLRRAIPWR